MGAADASRLDRETAAQEKKPVALRPRNFVPGRRSCVSQAKDSVPFSQTPAPCRCVAGHRVGQISEISASGWMTPVFSCSAAHDRAGSYRPGWSCEGDPDGDHPAVLHLRPGNRKNPRRELLHGSSDCVVLGFGYCGLFALAGQRARQPRSARLFLLCRRRENNFVGPDLQNGGNSVARIIDRGQAASTRRVKAGRFP